MKIYLGTVLGRVDINRSGTISASIDDIGIRHVEYVSPTAGSSAKFISIPRAGSRILICQPFGSLKYFYMGSCMGPERLANLGVDPLDIESNNSHDDIPHWNFPDIYHQTIEPTIQAWSSAYGAALILSDSASEANIRRFAALKSTKEHFLNLSDDPLNEGVTLRTNQGDPKDMDNPEDIIKITGKNTTDLIGPRSMLMECKRNMHQESRFGNYTQRVYNGGLMRLYNSSRNDYEPNDAGYFTNSQNGEIEIEAWHNDIHIYVRNPKANVVVESWGGNVQVYAGGDVRVHADGDVGLDAGGDINMKAGGNINLEGSQIHLNTPGQVNAKERLTSKREDMEGDLSLTD